MNLFGQMCNGTGVGICGFVFCVFHLYYKVFTPNGRGIWYKSDHFQAWGVIFCLFVLGPSAEVVLVLVGARMGGTPPLSFFSPLKKFS